MLRHPLALFVVVAAGYALGSELAFSWFGAGGLGATFFPAAGVSLAALVLVPRRRWPIVLAAAGLAELAIDLRHDLDLLPTVGWVVANLTQPVVGALLLGALVRRVDLSRTSDLAAFLAAAVVVAPAVGGALGATTFVVLADGEGWARFAAEWWVGDGLGVLVVAGAILSLRTRRPERGTPAAIGTGLLLGVAAVLATFAVFQLERFAFVYVPVVLLAALAFRAGTRGVALTGAAMAFVAAEATAEGSRYWDALDISAATGLLYLQLAIGVAVATGLALAAEIAQRERTALRLASVESERTAAVERARLVDSEQRARLQAESLSRSAAALARTATMDDVARASVSILAGWGAGESAFYEVQEDRLVLGAESGDGAPGDVAPELPMNGGAPAAEAIRTGAPVVVQDEADGEPGGGSSRPAGTIVAVPIVTGATTARAALVARTPHGPRPSDDWAHLLTTLADQAAVALERASLLQREQEARRRAEILERHAARLAGAATVPEVARTTISDLESIGVTAAWVQLLRGDEVEIVDASGVPPENVEQYARYPIEVATPPTDAIRTGRMVEISSGEDLDARYPAAADGRARLGYESLVSVPLRAAGGRTVGVLSFASDEARWLDDQRRLLVTGLAEQCGLALERAELQREADAAAEDAALLASLGEVLERATGTRERARALAHALVPSRTTFAAVRLVDEDGMPEPVAQAGEIDIEDDRLRQLAVDALEADGLARLDDGALLLSAIPLHARDRALGVLIAAAPADHPPRLGAVILQRIATRAALALDNALLYEQERDVSHSLQLGLLGGELVVPGSTTVATAYRPGTAMLEVGGDWYDAFPLPDDRLALLVGDVVGHGLEAAVAMGQLRGAVRALAPLGSPRRLLLQLDAFVETLPEAAMATLAYVELDPGTGRIAYACAGHPPPLLVPAEGEPRLLWDGRSPPLGSAFSEGREEAVDELKPGDTLVLYTDGLVERRADGFESGFSALLDVARETAPSPAELVDRILDELLVESTQDDDVCVLAARHAARIVRFEHSFPAAPEEVARMRRALTAWLEESGIAPETTRDVALAASEAAANAAEHAYAFDGRSLVHVEAWLSDGELHVSVRDAGRWRQPLGETDRGRGRTIMDALMRIVTIDSGEHGTVVRMSASAGAEAPS